LPTVEDRERLPYINAVVKEALRWHVVAPLGVPHRTDEDDIVDGYLIPRNAVLVPNIWYGPCVFHQVNSIQLKSLTGFSIMILRYILNHRYSGLNDTFRKRVGILSLIHTPQASVMDVDSALAALLPTRHCF
jgi:hypothetical protein